ncbi:hypothetical protein HBH70_221910 [Parastagonospora nodorum]|nr:hypothetical protein HBH53_225560 [Parastagonospora nodorum]KAH3956987.1 hypothetical protein HBH51_232180 [Parastagonospora nodorum]KAH3967346.1 hypothetical protein HBH52_189310 [Parastagonospora nodorum]KAH3993986.1 hypothetical protein HBI10_194430 [Parastagonospora nodorum]KAH4008700.1 hypothetical protein HBI13_231540 [Parastagonospora nodorum]
MLRACLADDRQHYQDVLFLERCPMFGVRTAPSSTLLATPTLNNTSHILFLFGTGNPASSCTPTSTPRKWRYTDHARDEHQHHSPNQGRGEKLLLCLYSRSILHSPSTSSRSPVN